MCRARWILAATLLTVLVLPATLVYADWDEGDDFKMHYPQLPDPLGWDVSASTPNIVADDWQCSETGYVSDIHIWGSWYMDNPEPPIPIINFHLEIWSDQPADPPGIPFSHPLEMLWFGDYGPDSPPGTYFERIYGDPSPQGFYDPIGGIVEPANHQITWQYNFFIPKEEAFIQEEGTIYWLVVQATLSEGAPPVWGWKTTLNHWNDDSVYIDAGGNWVELFDPTLPPEPENSLDQAFVITGDPLADWGDAPDPTYPTLSANNGANHTLGGALMLGATVDPEPDGQPDATATGDDNDGSNDDDGVVFNGPFIPGQQTPITLTVTAPCTLNGWMDFNGDGDWADQSETLWAGLPLSAGTHPINIGVPIGATLGQTYIRFRVTTSGALSYTGNAPDGEVEDYQVTIEEEQPLDFGDAPDAPFPTLLASNGARHIIDGVTFLGGPPDAEPDGQPDGTATGDDLAGSPDEDGVVWVSPLIPGFTAFVDVTASVPGMLDAWIDFNANGSWADPGEQIVLSFPLNPGVNNLMFPVPQGLSAAGVFARFRFSTAGGLNFIGQAPDGEVEDYEVIIEDPLEDWGDAPDPTYPTLSASNGAVHTLVETVYLGAGIPDAESNGQPDAQALGDDHDGQDDEDGVVHSPGTIIPSATIHVTVTASTTGFINAWVDFNGDGDWNDAGEQVFTNAPVVAGANSLSFSTPTTVVTPTFARYRFDTVGGLAATGSATDGEVEDYLFETPIFVDGFESGDTLAWSSTTP
jgi:hypothetical protein